MKLEHCIIESFFMIQWAVFDELETPSWLVSFWKGLCKFIIQIRLSQDIMKSSKKLNDRSITEEVMKKVSLWNREQLSTE